MASILGKPGGPGQFPTHDLSTVRGALHGVGQVYPDNRDAGRRLLGRQDARSGGSHDHIGLEPDQLFRQRRQAGRIAVGVAILDPVIAAFQVAKFSHA
jgi:hypothetical protein